MTSKRSNYELLARGLAAGESGTEGLQGGRDGTRPKSHRFGLEAVALQVSWTVSEVTQSEVTSSEVTSSEVTSEAHELGPLPSTSTGAVASIVLALTSTRSLPTILRSAFRNFRLPLTVCVTVGRYFQVVPSAL